MFSEVSWSEYLSLLSILLGVYYAAIILLFYRQEMLNILSGKRRLSPSGISSADVSPSINDYRTNDKISAQEEKQFALTNQLIQELQSILNRDLIKEELQVALQIKLRDYQELRGTAFEVSINNYIQKESENKCSINLSEEEIRSVWVR